MFWALTLRLTDCCYGVCFFREQKEILALRQKTGTALGWFLPKKVGLVAPTPCGAISLSPRYEPTLRYATQACYESKTVPPLLVTL